MSNEATTPVAAPAAEPTAASTDTGQGAVDTGAEQQVTQQETGNQEVQENVQSDTNQSENQNDTGSNQVRTEPTDLSEALEQVYEMESKATEEAVQKPEGTDQIQTEQQPANDNRDVNQGSTQTTAEQDTTSREVPDNTTQFDPALYDKQISDAARRASMREAVQEQVKAGVKLWNIEDCMRRDEETGKVFLINPNNGEQVDEFKAQEIVDLHNRWAKDAAQRTATQLYNEKMNSLKPAMETQKFINGRYQQMSEVERNVFNELIEPYAVNNKAGQRVGFSCDLNAFADKAASVVRQFAPQQQAQQQQSNMFNTDNKAPVETPAVDTPTGSSDPTGKANQPEPKNLSEALERVYEEKENNNG